MKFQKQFIAPIIILIIIVATYFLLSGSLGNGAGFDVVEKNLEGSLAQPTAVITASNIMNYKDGKFDQLSYAPLFADDYVIEYVCPDEIIYNGCVGDNSSVTLNGDFKISTCCYENKTYCKVGFWKGGEDLTLKPEISCR